MPARAEQFGFPRGRAGSSSIPARGCGGCRRNLPAHSRRGQFGRGIEPHQPQRHAVSFRRQAEAARGGKIERTRVARDLANHAGKVAASKPFLEREQGILGRSRFHMDQPVAQIGRQAMAAGTPAALHRAPVLDPQNLPPVIRLGQGIFPLCGYPQGIARQRQCHPGSTGIIGAGEYLAMQGLIGQAGTPPAFTRLRQGSDLERRKSRCRTRRVTGGRHKVGRRFRTGEKKGGFHHAMPWQRLAERLCSYYVPQPPYLCNAPRNRNARSSCALHPQANRRK